MQGRRRRVVNMNDYRVLLARAFSSVAQESLKAPAFNQLHLYRADQGIKGLLEAINSTQLAVQSRRDASRLEAPAPSPGVQSSWFSSAKTPQTAQTVAKSKVDPASLFDTALSACDDTDKVMAGHWETLTRLHIQLEHSPSPFFSDVFRNPAALEELITDVEWYRAIADLEAERFKDSLSNLTSFVPVNV